MQKQRPHEQNPGGYETAPVVLDSNLSDEAIDGGLNCDAALSALEINTRRFSVVVYLDFGVIEALVLELHEES